MRDSGAVKAGRAASLIFTLYGDFGVIFDSRLPAGSLVRLMAECGVAEQAVRQALSRMVAQGWLGRARDQGRAVYFVTEKGGERIAQISPRIYEPAAEWDGRWRIVVYGISERKRELRDRLRKDLTLLGLAPLAPSVWISPRDVRLEILNLARQRELSNVVQLFVGDYEGPASDREVLERCWNVEAIAAAYGDFIARYTPHLERERRTKALTDREAFGERLRLVQEFRKFLYIDPGLPSALLPAHWPGSVASGLFRQYYALIAQKAERFFRIAVREKHALRYAGSL